MFSIPFEYNGDSFTALVATKEIGEVLEYRITIMNGELEQLLYGYHIFNIRNGQILPESIPSEESTLELQKSLMRALATMENSVAEL